MILLAISLMSQKSTFSACWTTSDTPDCLEMITGTSWLMASSGAMPKGSETDGMTYRSAILKTFSTSPPRRKPVKSTLWPNAHRRGHLDRSADHVARAGHHELHVVHDLEHLLRRGEEILGAFLHRDSAEEQDDLLVLVDVVLVVLERAVAVGFDRVVDDFDLVRVDAVVMRDEVLGQVADRDDPHRAVHAATLDVVDSLIDVQAAAVEFGRVDVNDQRHALQAATARPAG